MRRRTCAPLGRASSCVGTQSRPAFTDNLRGRMPETAVCCVYMGMGNQAVQSVRRRLPDVVPAPEELPVFAARDERRARRLRAVGLGVVVLGALWVVAFFAGAIDFGRLPGVPRVGLGSSGFRSDHEPGRAHLAAVVPAAERVALSPPASSAWRFGGPRRSISPARPVNRPDAGSRRSKGSPSSSNPPLASPLAPPPVAASPPTKPHGRGSGKPPPPRKLSAPPGKAIAPPAGPRKAKPQPPSPGSTHVPPGLAKRIPR